MRITYTSLLVSLFCLVSTKYMPNESLSRVVSRKQRSDESNVSIKNTEDDINDNNTNFLERKGIEKQLKLQEKRNTTERQRLEKERKLQNKFVDLKRKLHENWQNAEGKWQKVTEKEKSKQQEERKREEKLSKEERKHQEKVQNQLEQINKKIIKESMLISDNSAISAVQNDLMDQGNIWKRYSKYALSTNSTELEKAAVLNRYLQEELGLIVNSECCQAVLQIIQNKLSNDSAIEYSLHKYLDGHVNAPYIQRLSAELETKIAELENGTGRFMQNVSLPWVAKVRQVIQQKKNFLKSLVRYLKIVLPNWIAGRQVDSITANGTNVHSSSNNATESFISGANVSVADPTVAVLVVQSSPPFVSGLANVLPVNASASKKAFSYTTSPNASATAGNSSNAAPINTSASMEITSNSTLPITSVFSNATTNEASTYVSSNNLTGTDIGGSVTVSTEPVPSSIDISGTAFNLLVTTASISNSSVATVINTIKDSAGAPVAVASQIIKVATPSEDTLNSSITTAANVAAVVSTNSQPSVITSGMYKVTTNNSVVSTTESGIVTENLENIMLTSAPQVAHTNVTQGVAG